MLEEGKYEVVSPLGERDIKWIDMARRIFHCIMPGGLKYHIEKVGKTWLN